MRSRSSSSRSIGVGSAALAGARLRHHRDGDARWLALHRHIRIRHGVEVEGKIIVGGDDLATFVDISAAVYAEQRDPAIAIGVDDAEVAGAQTVDSRPCSRAASS